MAFQPDGMILVSAALGGVVRISETKSGRTKWEMAGPDDMASAVCLSNKGSVSLGTLPGEVWFSSARTAITPSKNQIPDANTADLVKFNGGSKVLLTASFDGSGNRRPRLAWCMEKPYRGRIPLRACRSWLTRVLGIL